MVCRYSEIPQHFDFLLLIYFHLRIIVIPLIIIVFIVSRFKKLKQEVEDLKQEVKEFKSRNNPAA